MFWLIGTAFGLRNFLALTTLGVSPDFFEKIAIYWFMEGSGQKLGDPTNKNNLTEKNQKHVKNSILCSGFKKCVFVKNGAIFFRFRLLVPPIRAVRTGKT